MDYVKKTIVVSLIFSFIFSSFLLVTLQIDKKITAANFNKNVLGVTTETTSFCKFIDSLAIKFCNKSIVSSTLPPTGIGVTKSSIGSSLAPTQKVISYSDVEPHSITTIPGDDGKSAVISWNSDTNYVAKVEYGATAASMVLMSAENSSTNNHNISLTSLRPSTTYYFRIRVGSQIFDNNGIPYIFKTK